MKREEFQVWKLVVDLAAKSAAVTMSDGRTSRAIVQQDIEYTSFPFSEITLWLEGDDEQKVLVLPSER